MATITYTARHMIVTLDDGRTAKRATRNQYAAAIVGVKAGKLCVLSAHYDMSKARETLAAVKSGKFVNFNFAGATEIQIVAHQTEAK